MTVKLLTEHHVEPLSLKGGYTGLFESTLVKIPHCWKSHVAAHICIYPFPLRVQSYPYLSASTLGAKYGARTQRSW